MRPRLRLTSRGWFLVQQWVANRPLAPEPAKTITVLIGPYANAKDAYYSWNLGAFRG